MAPTDTDHLVTLPLTLWHTPPGLQSALAQEGIPYNLVPSGKAPSSNCRFVVYDGHQLSSSRVRKSLQPGQQAIKVHSLSQARKVDPFRALTDTRTTRRCWRVGDLKLEERVALHDKAHARSTLIDALRNATVGENAPWLRLAPFPYPYRSAFNLRVDLDEYQPDDYWSFARAREPIADCTSHFVCTSAYGNDRAIMTDLCRHDTQSHGHYHFVYRDAGQNLLNLQRAHKVMADAGLHASAFAAPSGRWNHALDSALETLGYIYSSDFQTHYDDWPAHPWLGNRFSKVLQVPVHPVCEGLFFDKGQHDPNAIAAYLIQVVEARIDAEEPAFIYGHPDSRLGRYPQIVSAIAQAVSHRPHVWRTTLTQFAQWWIARSKVQWSAIDLGTGRFEIQLATETLPPGLAIEIAVGDRVATVPVRNERFVIDANALAYRTQNARHDPAPSWPLPRQYGLRPALLSWLDWEKVTPIEALSTQGPRAKLKKALRQWRDRQQQIPTGTR